MSSPDEIIANITKQLDDDEAASACATLALFLRQCNQPPKLKGVCVKLCKLISSEDDSVKANAMSALSSGFEISDEFAAEALICDAASDLIAALNSTDPPPAPRVALNALGALGALGETSKDALHSVVSKGGVKCALSFCSPEKDPAVLEAAVDTLCKLMSCGNEAKIAAVEAGSISAMAALLPLDIRNDDVRVRCLLALGMVVGGNETCQVQLASTAGAVESLLLLMRREDDADCQQIAAGIFSELAKSPAAKDAVAAAIKKS